MDPFAQLTGGNMLQNIMLLLGAFVVAYVYFAVCLQLLARKTGTPGGWKAWVPFVNLALMARIGGRSLIWAVLCLVPLLGLIPFIMIWGSIAKTRGKSALLGVLIIVPLVNFVLPLILLAGGSPESPVVPAGRSAVPASGPLKCLACGAPYEPGELYCTDCGQSLAAEQHQPPAPVAVAASAPSGGRGGLWVAALFLLALVGVGVYVAAGRLGISGAGTASSGGSRQAAAMPTRLSGVLREFPVDSAATGARPTSVVSQNLRVKDSSATTPASWLPKGVEPSKLADVGASLTSARYQEGPTGPAVNVHVLETDPGTKDAARQVADRVVEADGGGTTQGRVQVKSPNGATYEGWKLTGPTGQSYVLGKQDAPIVVLIFSPTSASNGLADRLAANVGNGEGLLDYPEVRTSLSGLPSELPPGFTLDEMANYGTDDILTADTQSSVVNGLGLGGAGLMDVIRRALPSTLAMGRYRDTSQRSWNVLSGDYGSFFRSFLAWYAIRAALAASGLPNDAADDGFIVHAGSGTFVLRKEGNRIRVVRGDARAPTGPLLALAGVAGAVPSTTAPTSAASPATALQPTAATASGEQAATEPSRRIAGNAEPFMGQYRGTCEGGGRAPFAVAGAFRLMMPDASDRVNGSIAPPSAGVSGTWDRSTGEARGTFDGSLGGRSSWAGRFTRTANGALTGSGTGTFVHWSDGSVTCRIDWLPGDPGLSLLGQQGAAPGVAAPPAAAAAGSGARGFEGTWSGTQTLTQGLAGETLAGAAPLGIYIENSRGRWTVREVGELHIWLFLQWSTPEIRVEGDRLFIRAINSAGNEDAIELRLQGNELVGRHLGVVRNMGPDARPDQLGTRISEVRLMRSTIE